MSLLIRDGRLLIIVADFGSTLADGQKTISTRCLTRFIVEWYT